MLERVRGQTASGTKIGLRPDIRRLLLFLATACCLFLTACSNPLPPERQDYIGLWLGDGMYLDINATGRVVYKRLRDGQTTSIKAPLQEFRGNDFKVGVGFLNTIFRVSEPPKNLGGQWRMVVDGVQLFRKSEREKDSGPLSQGGEGSQW